MRGDISSVMGKLTGAELGKLSLKDDIGILVGIARTYSEDDFDMALSKQDRSNKVKYVNYGNLTMMLKILCLTHKWNLESIETLCLRLNLLRVYTMYAESLNISRELLTIERIKDNFGNEAGETESWLRDMFDKILEGLLDQKDGISLIYDNLRESVIQYFNYRDLIKGLAERIGFPELADITGDISDIETLNVWAVGKRLESPYKELFQKIDIEELEQKKQTDIQEKIDEIMTLIED